MASHSIDEVKNCELLVHIIVSSRLGLIGSRLVANSGLSQDGPSMTR